MNLDEFKKEVSKLGLDVTSEKLDLLERYYNLLIEWNKKINLTAIIEKKEVYLKHFYDSLTVCKVIDLNTVQSLCDIGTGAGFPGLVLKIFFPHLKLYLLDSLAKRIKFLDFVVNELNLDDVYTIHARAEEYGLINREKFDVVIARAVSSFNVLLEFSIPLVKQNMYFISMRGQDNGLNYESALKLLGCELIKKELFYLPFENSCRTILMVKKNKITDKKFPRRFSEIKKRPL